MNTMPQTAEMERAYLERDASYNGLFFLGVRTTGIFCRPTCPARKPLPKNVEYFPTARAALVAGYRPCKRCRPLEPDDQPPWAADLLIDVERDPSSRITDGDLRARGIDPATVRRYFLRQYGMTFQAFTRARRLSGGLEPDPRKRGARYRRVRERVRVPQRLPRCVRPDVRQPARAGTGTAKCVFLSWLRSPLGPLVAGATAEGICLLEFTDRRMLEAQFAAVRKLFDAPVVPGSNEHLETAARSNSRTTSPAPCGRFRFRLVYPGTPFQRRVWEQAPRHSLWRDALV